MFNIFNNNFFNKFFLKKEMLATKKAKMKRINKDFNMRLFLLKESFLQNISTYNFSIFFKIEWMSLYKNKIIMMNNIKNYFFIQYYNTSNFFFMKNSNMNLNMKKYQTKKNYLFKNTYKNNLYWGFISFWKAFKIWLFSIFFGGVTFYVLIVKRTAILPQTLFFWVGVSMLLYWLLSGFVFFVKKYQFSSYTSVIQRFWSRSYMLFWLMESGLLLVFFYLVMNSSQESFYMFDQGYFLKSHLFSWKIFIFKCMLVVSLISYSYLMLLNIKWNTFNKNMFNLFIMTSLLLYFVWTEFYQMYWVSNFYANFFWSYDFEESIWSLEWDASRTSILNHYIMVLFLLKFWHIVFIFGCWIFFLLSSNELETITYPLYSFNFQNFLILFLMMWLFMYPWFKHTFHWFSELPYFWFYVDTHSSFFSILINDMLLFYYSWYQHFIEYRLSNFFYFNDFIYWNMFDSMLDSNVFMKHTIKNVILQKLM